MRCRDERKIMRASSGEKRLRIDFFQKKEYNLINNGREDFKMKTNKKIMAIVAVIALVAILGVCLVACNASSYTKKLEKKGYTVTNLLDSASGESMDKSKIEWAIMAAKGGNIFAGDLGDMVTVVKFKKTADAKESEQAAKDSGQSVYRTGKIVMAGTEQGVKDAK